MKSQKARSSHDFPGKWTEVAHSIKTVIFWQEQAGKICLEDIFGGYFLLSEWEGFLTPNGICHNTKY
jgi:hypothetical protein